jgi:hypothetical protein
MKDNNWVGWCVIFSTVFADFFDILAYPRFFTTPLMFWWWNILSLLILYLDFNARYKIVKRK